MISLWTDAQSTTPLSCQANRVGLDIWPKVSDFLSVRQSTSAGTSTSISTSTSTSTSAALPTLLHNNNSGFLYLARNRLTPSIAA